MANQEHGADDALVEAACRAWREAEGMNPDCLYQHHEWEEYPTDERREYSDPFTGEPRVQLFHRSWRNLEIRMRAAITAYRQQERQNQDGASGQAVAADRSEELHRADDFQGDDNHLIDCIDAFLDLSDKQAFVPLNIGKGHHAYRLLCAARHRFAQAIEARAPLTPGQLEIVEGLLSGHMVATGQPLALSSAIINSLALRGADVEEIRHDR